MSLSAQGLDAAFFGAGKKVYPFLYLVIGWLISIHRKNQGCHRNCGNVHIVADMLPCGARTHFTDIKMWIINLKNIHLIVVYVVF